MDHTTQLQKLKQEAISAINDSPNSKQLEQIGVRFLGRKSKLTGILRNLKDIDPESRKQVGSLANSIRQELTSKIEVKLAKHKLAELSASIQSDKLDLGLPAIPSLPAKVHPITTERAIIEDIFQRMGFTVHQPYLIDDEYHNFTSLNIPEGHPARDMWDTIRVDENLVMITHTSSMQNRLISQVKESGKPVRAIVPGKCFRNEATDATHEHSFFQIEGVYVDKGIKLSDMIGTLSEFLNQYFQREVPLKIQPTFFPFVEPGLEIMMPKPGTGSAEAEFDPETTDWMEVIPCGPIHPNVLKEAGVDPEVYSGFAWGLGLERLIMIKKQINDLRYFHSGRIDFVNQF